MTIFSTKQLKIILAALLCQKTTLEAEPQSDLDELIESIQFQLSRIETRDSCK